MSARPKFIPQKNSVPLSPEFFVVAVLGATAIGAGAMVFLFNPATHNFYPVCLFHALTGLNCPGCGMTRSLYALLHGNFRLALKDNALFVTALAMLLLGSFRFILRKLQNQPAILRMPPKFLWLVLVIAFVFAVVRNLPGFEWLAP